MDKEKKLPQEETLDTKPEATTDDNWLDSILGTSTPSAELGPDELAVSAAGLTHPDDLELEKILAEDWDSVPDEEEMEQTSFLDQTQYFEPVTEEALQREVAQEQEAAEEAEPEPEVQEQEAPDKREKLFKRPKNKEAYGFFGLPHVLSTLAWLLIIVVVGVTLGRAIWLGVSDVMAFGKENLSVSITITEEDNIDTISQKLADAGIIRYPGLFKLFATLTEKDQDISVGTFTLSSSLDYNALIRNMRTYGPAREEITVTIPEGYNCAQIFKLLEEKGVCSAAELEQYAASGELREYWFLDGVERGSKYCLEGYLFPDTYFFYTNDTPRHALEKMLNGFDSRFTNRMKEKYKELLANSSLKLSLHQVITLASMIEKETVHPNESYDISAVYHNRLKNSASFPYLDCDATIYYAIGDYFGTHGPLTIEDMETDSPYNTSWRGGHTGLPIGPICNPGASSIDAALSPNRNGYFYYVYDPSSGKHLFANTLYEHNINVSKVG